jgi:hypothetical protein
MQVLQEESNFGLRLALGVAENIIKSAFQKMKKQLKILVRVADVRTKILTSDTLTMLTATREVQCPLSSQQIDKCLWQI